MQGTSANTAYTGAKYQANHAANASHIKNHESK
jgi:hypothetical protein